MNTYFLCPSAPRSLVIRYRNVIAMHIDTDHILLGQKSTFSNPWSP